MNQFVMGALRNGAAEPYDFAIGDLLGEAWRRVHGMKATVWGALLFIILISIAFSIGEFIASYFFGESKLISVLFQIASVLVTFPLTIGLQYLGMRRSVDLPIFSKQIFSMYDFWGKIIGLLILQTLILYALIFATAILAIIISSLEISSIARALLMLIPIALGLFTLYVSMSFIFAYLLIVEKRLGVWSAYKASYWAYTQHWFKIVIAVIVVMFIYLLSIALLLIGLIWTVPWMVNFNGILYRIAFGVEEVRAKV